MEGRIPPVGMSGTIPNSTSFFLYFSIVENNYHPKIILNIMSLLFFLYP
jgi:hypothetical protein